MITNDVDSNSFAYCVTNEKPNKRIRSVPSRESENNKYIQDRNPKLSSLKAETALRSKSTRPFVVYPLPAGEARTAIPF